MEKRTKKDIVKNMSIRRTAWDYAVEMLDPLITTHGLEDYRIGPGLFASGTNTTSTKVDQHLDHIQRVAEWLLEPTV